MSLTISDLNNAIAALGASMALVTTDVHAAFARSQVELPSLNVKAGAAVSAGVVSAPAGSVVDVPINYQPGPAKLAAIQFDIVLPPGAVLASVTTGPAAIAAGKSVNTAMVGGAVRFLIFGVNQNIVGAGVLATMSVGLPSTTGLFSLPMTRITGSDPNGIAAILSGMSGSITIT